MKDPAGSVIGAFDEVWARFTARLEGLEDAEYFWEPVPGCWSVRQGRDGRWRIDGDGGDGGPAGAPVPPPFTTIAWRIGHIGLSFIGFGDRLFADGRITLRDVEFAPTAPAALAWLEEVYRRHWRDDLAAMDAARWQRPIGPAFGAYADRSGMDLALHVLDELTHHAAEVALLRDLYRHRDRLGRS
ncbi:DinB family protein [Thermomonospora curvata]|uniref:DinB-like domain-containing protein n=1 Tax=Thermomonospora curvata (strain ATCC 19995 / DSM 43183 / JCM 3096 / KCTC 9072 / NBRC 15933 / NCIMB 10081 / Henssen B9) TaxID=471852 RepID=D1A739_THECD|nr:DinB family protein [Thermomonospora curvata]ACZ00245.1 hypothetical protein Tcur_4723 [Thermomonospora curvata DSM 43183]